MKESLRKGYFFFPLPAQKRTNWLLLDSGRPVWVLLNETGGSIVQLILEGKEDPQILDELSRKYHTLPEGTDQHIKLLRRQLNLLFSKGTSVRFDLQYRRPLKSLFLTLTRFCNLSCPQCYAGSSKDLRAVFELRDLERVLDEFWEMGGEEITLSGGEPLLYPDLLRLIKDFSSKLQILLITNGILLDEEVSAFLAEQGVSVQISLDGSCEAVHDRIRGRGSFQRAIEGLQRIQEAGVEDVNITTTIMRMNQDDLSNIIALAKRLGVPLVRFIPLRRMGRAVRLWDHLVPRGWPQSIDALYERLIRSKLEGNGEREGPRVSPGVGMLYLGCGPDNQDDRWCAIGSTLALDANGDAYPCGAFLGSSFKVGNVKHQSLSEILEAAPLKRFVEALRSREERIPECRECVWKALCQSGCMALAFDWKRSIWHRDYLCRVRRRLYPLVFQKVAEGASISFRPDLCD